jgi:hypothetical protein
MSNQQELANRLATLNDAQLKYVCGRLLEDLQAGEEPLLTEEDRKARQEEDRDLVREAARQTHAEPAPAANDREAAVGFLVAVADTSPEARQSIEAALAELDAGTVKMDFGITFAAAILLPAIAAAIIRPKVEYSSSESGKSRKKEFKLDVRGVKDIGAVIKKVLPFVSS